MRKINKAFIHCSATPEGKEYSVETIRSWHKKKGWSDIGYHYVISLDGVLQEGRPIEKVGAHARGHNVGSIGVCYIGGVDANNDPKDTMTEAQETCMVNLLQSLKEQYPDITFHGHNEVANKACPSFNVQDKYGWITK